MTKPILIIGGGPAGLAAAHSLGTVGRKSILVEKEDQLGGAPILSGYAKLVPTGEWAKDAIGGMVKRVEDDDLVQIETGAKVTTFDGEPGNFNVELSNGKKIEAEAAIMCTGFTHFDSVNKPEWGFGTHEDVVTTTQVEQMISSGNGVRCPSDDASQNALQSCSVSDRETGRSDVSGVRKSAAPSLQTWQWRFAKNYPIVMSTFTTWTSEPSVFTKPSTTGRVRKSLRSNI